jgi:hypothetical protein
LFADNIGRPVAQVSEVCSQTHRAVGRPVRRRIAPAGATEHHICVLEKFRTAETVGV